MKYGLDDLYHKLSQDELVTLFNNFKAKFIELSSPKFDSDGTLQNKEEYSRLGLDPNKISSKNSNWRNILLSVTKFFANNKHTLVVNDSSGWFRKLLAKCIPSNKRFFQLIAIVFTILGFVINISANIIGRHLVGFAAILLPLGIIFMAFIELNIALKKYLESHASQKNYFEKLTYKQQLNMIVNVIYVELYAYHKGWKNTEAKESFGEKVPMPDKKQLMSIKQQIYRKYKNYLGKFIDILRPVSFTNGITVEKFQEKCAEKIKQLATYKLPISKEEVINVNPDKLINNRYAKAIIFILPIVPSLSFSLLFLRSDIFAGISMILISLILLSKAFNALRKNNLELPDAMKNLPLKFALEDESLREMLSKVKSKSNVVLSETSLLPLRRQIIEEFKDFNPALISKESYEEATSLIAKTSKGFVIKVISSDVDYDLKVKILEKVQNISHYLNPLTDLDIICKILREADNLEYLACDLLKDLNVSLFISQNLNSNYDVFARLIELPQISKDCLVNLDLQQLIEVYRKVKSQDTKEILEIRAHEKVDRDNYKLLYKEPRMICTKVLDGKGLLDNFIDKMPSEIKIQVYTKLISRSIDFLKQKGIFYIKDKFLRRVFIVTYLSNPNSNTLNIQLIENLFMLRKNTLLDDFFKSKKIGNKEKLWAKLIASSKLNRTISKEHKVNIKEFFGNLYQENVLKYTENTLLDKYDKIIAGFYGLITRYNVPTTTGREMLKNMLRANSFISEKFIIELEAKIQECEKTFELNRQG